MTIAVQLGLAGYAASSLRRRAARTAALSFGLILAVALLGSVLLLTSALRAEAARTRDLAPDLTVQHLVGGRPSLVPVTLAESIRTHPGVRSARARVWGYVYVAAIQANVTIVGLETLAPGHAALGRELAAALGTRAGDRFVVPLPGHGQLPVDVDRELPDAASLYAPDVLFLAESDARAALAVPAGQAVDVAVDLIAKDESAVLAHELVDRTPGTRVIEKRLLERVQTLSYGRRAGFVLGGAIPALLALLVLAWDRATGIGPLERREIAILKSAGWSAGDVLTAKLYEAAFVGVGGTALGLVLAYAFCFVLGAPGLREVLAGWTTVFPARTIAPAVDGGTILGLLALVAAPFVALSVGPAWRAAQVDPLEAMREG